MERQQHERERQPEGPDWDATPRDGPAVLVVNTRLLDQGIGLEGGWVQLDGSVPEVAQRLGEIVGGGDQGDYAVVDQVGLGPIMWDDEVAMLLGLAGGRS